MIKIKIIEKNDKIDKLNDNWITELSLKRMAESQTKINFKLDKIIEHFKYNNVTFQNGSLIYDFHFELDDQMKIEKSKYLTLINNINKYLEHIHFFAYFMNTFDKNFTESILFEPMTDSFMSEIDEYYRHSEIWNETWENELTKIINKLRENKDFFNLISKFDIDDEIYLIKPFEFYIDKNTEEWINEISIIKESYEKYVVVGIDLINEELILENDKKDRKHICSNKNYIITNDYTECNKIIDDLYEQCQNEIKTKMIEINDKLIQLYNSLEK